MEHAGPPEERPLLRPAAEDSSNSDIGSGTGSGNSDIGLSDAQSREQNLIRGMRFNNKTSTQMRIYLPLALNSIVFIWLAMLIHHTTWSAMPNDGWPTDSDYCLAAGIYMCIVFGLLSLLICWLLRGMLRSIDRLCEHWWLLFMLVEFWLFHGTKVIYFAKDGTGWCDEVGDASGANAQVWLVVVQMFTCLLYLMLR